MHLILNFLTFQSNLIFLSNIDQINLKTIIMLEFFIKSTLTFNDIRYLKILHNALVHILLEMNR